MSWKRVGDGVECLHPVDTCKESTLMTDISPLLMKHVHLVRLRQRRQRRVPLPLFLRRARRRQDPASRLSKCHYDCAAASLRNLKQPMGTATAGNGIGLRTLRPAEWRGPVILYSQTLWR